MWAADGDGILYYDGNAWTQVYERASPSFRRIDGSGPSGLLACQ